MSGVTINQMRAMISGVYNGKKWAAKVAHMPDGQVIAIYQDFLRTGKFEKKGKRPLRPKKKEKHETVAKTDYVGYSNGIGSARQLSFFDEGV